MRILVIISVAVLSVAASNAAQSGQHRRKATHSDSTASSSGTKGKTASRRASASSVPRQRAQQAPTPERYKEIQQALADKGYFKGNVDGQWGPDSVDALKRFQADQNLDADGKLSSLSIIALGLGPKRGAAQAQASQPANPSNSPVTVESR